MGTRFVFKKGLVTYVVSDVSPQISTYNMDAYNTYIEVIQKDVILAYRAHEPISDLLSNYKEWFLTDDGRPMDKKHVINKIVKPLVKKAIQHEFINEKTKEMNNVIYIITKHRMFQILSGFSVVEADIFLSANAEEEFAFYAFNKHEKESKVENDIKILMNDLHEHFIFVHKDYVYMDNENYQYVYIKGGGVK
jgi:hypothetical protein